MTTPTDWDDYERRAEAASPPPGDGKGGFTLEQLSYLESRISREVTVIHTMLRAHVSDESRQLDLIKAMIDRSAAASEARHEMLLQKLAAYQTRTDSMEQAFLDGPMGLPDYHGHHQDHSIRAATGKWWSGVKSTVVSDGIKAALGGLIVWLAMIVYQSSQGVGP